MTPELFAKTIASIEQNYGLRLDARSVWLRMDDWKRLGRDQMGQKCGRGWQGLRGACKRVPKGGDKESAIKASKVALADKIRKNKGMRDRNVPKVEKFSVPKGRTTLNLARGDYGREGFLTTEVHAGWTNGYLAKLSPDKNLSLDRSFVSASDKETSRAGNGQKHYKLSSLDDGIYEAETVVRSGIKERHYLKVKDGTITNKFNGIDDAENDAFPELKSNRQKLQDSKRQASTVAYGALTGSEKQISWASSLRDKGAKQVLDELSVFPDSSEKTKAIKSVNEFVSSRLSSRDWIDNRDRLGSWIKKGASEKV